MVLREYTGSTWSATDASWVSGCQAEDEWLLEAWERMTCGNDLYNQGDAIFPIESCVHHVWCAI